MKELSLFLLDISKNSTAAGAALTRISLIQSGDSLTMQVADNGCGMSPELLSRVTDPFTTTRTTRKVGMGIPLLKMTAEMTGGSFCITSELGVGTTTTARFVTSSVDMPPLGDLAGSVMTLIQGSPDQDFLYTRQIDQQSFTLDTRELREMLGDDIPLDAPEVSAWIADYLKQQEAALLAGAASGPDPETRNQ